MRISPITYHFRLAPYWCWADELDKIAQEDLEKTTRTVTEFEASKERSGIKIGELAKTIVSGIDSVLQYVGLVAELHPATKVSLPPLVLPHSFLFCYAGCCHRGSGIPDGPYWLA